MAYIIYTIVLITASKMVVNAFLADKSTTSREKDLFKSLKVLIFFLNSVKEIRKFILRLMYKSGET